MSILDGGCQCLKCAKANIDRLNEARQLWKENKLREITFKSYHYECSDGCCSEWGTNVYINGFGACIDGESVESVAEGLMEFLEIDDVKILYEDED